MDLLALGRAPRPRFEAIGGSLERSAKAPGMELGGTDEFHGPEEERRPLLFALVAVDQGDDHQGIRRHAMAALPCRKPAGRRMFRRALDEYDPVDWLRIEIGLGWKRSQTRLPEFESLLRILGEKGAEPGGGPGIFVDEQDVPGFSAQRIAFPKRLENP